MVRSHIVRACFGCARSGTGFGGFFKFSGGQVGSLGSPLGGWFFVVWWTGWDAVGSGLLWGLVCGGHLRKATVLLTTSIKGAGIGLNVFSKSGLGFGLHFSASRGGADSRLTIRLFAFLRVCGVSTGDVSNTVVDSIIPGFACGLEDTVVAIANGGDLLVNPKLGANLSVGVRRPRALNTSVITNYIKTYRGCNNPLVVVFVKATATVICISTDGTCRNNTVTPNVKVSLSTLAGRNTLLSSISVGTPGEMVSSGASSYVHSKVVFKATYVLSKVISVFGRRYGARYGIITANNLTPLTVGGYHRSVVFSRGVVLSKLGVVCREGGGWERFGVRLIFRLLV